jgi:hypothetical protein
VLRRRQRFEQTIAEAWEAIERGDLERAKALMYQLPERRRREAARTLIARANHTSPLAPGDPELVLDLFDQAHNAAVSRIGDYARGPALTRRMR